MIDACPRYIPDPVHLLTEDTMCVPDLYTFVKLYGTDQQVQELASLRKLRRRLLIRIYREVRRDPQRIRRFFGRTDLPPVPPPFNGNNNGNNGNNNGNNNVPMNGGNNGNAPTTRIVRRRTRGDCNRVFPRNDLDAKSPSVIENFDTKH